MRGSWLARDHDLLMTTVLGIGLVLAGWIVLPFPLAVLVGRSLRSARAGAGLSSPI
jgi:hypothetical protein